MIIIIIIIIIMCITYLELCPEKYIFYDSAQRTALFGHDENPVPSYTEIFEDTGRRSQAPALMVEL